jgi:hypothetical protein
MLNAFSVKPRELDSSEVSAIYTECLSLCSFLLLPHNNPVTNLTPLRLHQFFETKYNVDAAFAAIEYFDSELEFLCMHSFSVLVLSPQAQI